MKPRKLLFFLAVIFCLFTCGQNTAFAQTRKKKTIKPKPIRAEVLVKTDLGKDPKNINEDKPELWNKYSSPENAFEIEFPSKTENVFKDNPVENIVLFEAKTGKATYSVIVKPFESKVLPDEVEILYDQLTEQLFLKGSGKVISFKNVNTNDFAGREVVFDLGENRVYGQIYIVENRLYIVSVYIKKTRFTPEFEVWVNKFFDSFVLKYNKINVS